MTLIPYKEKRFREKVNFELWNDQVEDIRILLTYFEEELKDSIKGKPNKNSLIRQAVDDFIAKHKNLLDKVKETD